MKNPVPPQIQPIIQAISVAGGRPLIVGGAVRDAMLGVDAHDADIEAYDIDLDTLIAAMEQIGRVDLVGKAFGILKVTLPDGMTVDVSVPRRENRIGVGHKAFRAEFDAVSPQEAAARRDFTMNALAYDPQDGVLLDYFGGVNDLRAYRLRHTSDAFSDDPLRVLRGMRFCARFHLWPDWETVELCRPMLPEAHSLPRERVWKEWEGWAMSPKPSAGLDFLYETGWINLYPDLMVLGGCQQDEEWHPEGTVWEHTKQVCDWAAWLSPKDSPIVQIVLVLAALCHDLGKPATTIYRDGHVRSPGHAEVGVDIAERFLGQIGAPQSIIRLVQLLVREHLAHVSAPPTPRTVRRLAHRLDGISIEAWAILVEADASGRKPLPPSNPALPWVQLARTMNLGQDKPEPILHGRDLIAVGYEPGPRMGRLLRAAFEAQLDGDFATISGGVLWVNVNAARIDSLEEA